MDKVETKLESAGLEGTMMNLTKHSDFEKQLDGYGLTTAHIFYRRPDHPWLLQSYIWQDYDLCPAFPELQRFLQFWQQKLEGPLHSVMVAHSRLIRPAEMRAVGGEFRLH
jgi:uncharacterized protein Usg